MTEKRSPGKLTPSICEPAFEEYIQLEDSMAALIKESCVDVRDFIILSIEGDQGNLSTAQIAHILGLSLEKTGIRIDRPIEAGLIQCKDETKNADGGHSNELTATGRMLTVRVHGLQGGCLYWFEPGPAV